MFCSLVTDQVSWNGLWNLMLYSEISVYKVVCMHTQNYIKKVMKLLC
jgi:hypothetical protein